MASSQPFQEAKEKAVQRHMLLVSSDLSLRITAKVNYLCRIPYRFEPPASVCSRRERVGFL